jgi:hypothetical protein
LSDKRPVFIGRMEMHKKWRKYGEEPLSIGICKFFAETCPPEAGGAVS